MVGLESAAYLYCLGTSEENRWLHARLDGTGVNLAPSLPDDFEYIAGAAWSISRSQTPGVYYLSATIPSNQTGIVYLDGRITDGTVGLAPSTEGGFTGTRWCLSKSREGTDTIYTLQCMGSGGGQFSQGFLDGRTQDGTIGLATPLQQPSFSGTCWKILTEYFRHISFRRFS